MPTTFPVLRYQDARTAIRWLSTAFGFVELRAAKVCRCGHATEAHQRRSMSVNAMLRQPSAVTL